MKPILITEDAVDSDVTDYLQIRETVWSELALQQAAHQVHPQAQVSLTFSQDLSHIDVMVTANWLGSGMCLEHEFEGMSLRMRKDEKIPIEVDWSMLLDPRKRIGAISLNALRHAVVASSIRVVFSIAEGKRIRISICSRFFKMKSVTLSTEDCEHFFKKQTTD